MISIATLVHLFLFLLGAAAIVGLLWYLVVYCEREFPGVPLLFRALRILLVLGAVLILIGVIMHMMGTPLVKWE